MPRCNYFAYGSNMDEARMLSRCPSARLVGPATLPGYHLRERLYADIDKAEGKAVWGLLWTIEIPELATLDRFEGVPVGIYARKVLRIRHKGKFYNAYTYEMTSDTKRTRAGLAFPRWYLAVCRQGALDHGVRGFFGKTTKGA